MTFRPIGELAGNVMVELATKRSAGAASAEIGGEMARRENTTTSPFAQVARGLATSNSGMGKGPGRSPAKAQQMEIIMKPPQGSESGAIRMACEPSPNERPVLRVIEGGRGMGSVHRRRNETGFPSPALPSPMLLLVVGGHYATEP